MVFVDCYGQNFPSRGGEISGGLDTCPGLPKNVLGGTEGFSFRWASGEVIFCIDW